ncbi:hypothetical protein [Kribbella swartbergensis]
MTSVDLPLTNSAQTTVRFRSVLLAAACVFAAVSQTAFFVMHRAYERDEVLPYDVIRGVRTQWWVTHYFVGTALAFGLGMAGLAMAYLVRRGRGSGWTTIGAALCLLGAPALAAGVAAEGVVYYYVTDQQGLAPGAAAKLLAYADPASADSVIGLLIIGLILNVLGTSAACVGLLISRSVPLWVPVAVLAGTVAMAATPFSITWLAALPRAVGIVAVGWYLLRPSGGESDVG